MSSRFIALAITLVVFWSSVSTPEQVAPLGSAHAEQAGVALPLHADDGSIDERSAQAQDEGGADTPALVMAGQEVNMPMLTLAGPRPHAAAAWLSPCLAGPLRPPCAASRVA